MTLNRRHFLASSTSLLALPHLQVAASETGKAPQRVVFLGFGFGFTEDFYATTFGSDYELTPSMESLEKHKQDFTVISNLWHKNARGAHGGTVVYLTGADAHGPTARNTVSCDQVAARYMGNETRFASIQVTTREKGGGHGGGSSLSWHENGTSMSGVAEPFRMYNMLFGGQGTPYEQRLAELQNEKSVLDAYVGNISSLNRNASKLDRERLDHYFQSLREVEQRIAREKLWARKPKPRVDYKLPAAELDGVQEITAMYDLILLAMQTDLSRVITYRQPIESLLKTLDIKYSAHAISHYQKGEDLKKAMIVRERKQTELFASFIDRLKATKDVDGSRLFDNCLVSYGSNLRAGHMLKNVPAFVTGNASGKLRHGRHVKMPQETPLCNLWLTLLQTLNSSVKQFGDSNGVLSDLFA
jgi:hypothetical protein